MLPGTSCFDHVSSNISCHCCCYLGVPFHQFAPPPGFHVTHIPKGNLLCLYCPIPGNRYRLRQHPSWDEFPRRFSRYHRGCDSRPDGNAGVAKISSSRYTRRQTHASLDVLHSLLSPPLWRVSAFKFGRAGVVWCVIIS